MSRTLPLGIWTLRLDLADPEHPKPGSVERPTHVTFLLNFSDELRRRTAAAR